MASISSSTGVLTGTWWPKTDAERESVNQQLDRILNSSVFRSSKRYPALLRYIVEQTLDGRGEALKERILGTEVFGRSPDYDTNSDHVVRTAAGEVRKRLAQYYMGEGSDDDIRIEVPAGSYVAQFRLASENLTLHQMAALAPRMPALEIPLPKRKWFDRRLVLGASLIVNAALAVFVIAGAAPWTAGTATLQKFWNPVFSSSDPILICVGLQDGSQNQTAQSAASTDPLFHRVAMADLLTLARVTNYAGERHARYRVLDPASTSLSDLRNEPTILIGAGNNNWTKRVADQLRFSFLINEANPNRPLGVVDRQKKGSSEWLRAPQPAESFRDYAIVSRLIDPRVEQVVVILGGLGAHGTEVAGEFVTNPDQMKKLEAYAPAGWAGKNLQVVLSTEVVKGSSGPPKIEATYFW